MEYAVQTLPMPTTIQAPYGRTKVMQGDLWAMFENDHLPTEYEYNAANAARKFIAQVKGLGVNAYSGSLLSYRIRNSRNADEDDHEFVFIPIG